MPETVEFITEKVENIRGKWRKCWLLSHFSPQGFRTPFSLASSKHRNILLFTT